jgi:HEAT repeat protein
LAGHTGDERAARSRLKASDPGVRATAYGALARLGRLTSADLRRALRDPAPAVRVRGCELATAEQAPTGNGAAVLRALCGALDGGEPSVVESAAWALGEIPRRRRPREAIATLIGVAGTHEDPLCREAAVAALGSIGHSDGLAAVLAATVDKPAVRRRAVIALAAFDGPEVEAALERARADRDWQVRQAAEDLLGAAPT